MNWFIKALRHYADFNGRAHREEYWMFVLFNVLFFLAWTFLAALIAINAGRNPENALMDIYLIYYAIMALPGMAVTARRLHDIGKSGWMQLVALIPIVGGIWMLVLMVTRGQESENRYGQNPKDSIKTFGEREKLRSAGIAITVAASIEIVCFVVRTFFMQYSVGIQHIGQMIYIAAYLLLFAAGIFLSDATTIHGIKGKTKNALLLILASSAMFLLLNIAITFSTGIMEIINWVRVLHPLLLVLFTTCILYASQNKDLTAKTAIAVIVLSSLNFLWRSYNVISSDSNIESLAKMLFTLGIFTMIADIVLAATFYSFGKKSLITEPKVDHTDTGYRKAEEIPDPPK